VFDYNGNFLRQIGGEGITNYPIGVGINSNNEILVADNHNNFNLTVFSQEGKLINALESKVKHAQCFDVGLMDDGSIVLASKDYRIYVYKYSSNLDNGLMLMSSTSPSSSASADNAASASSSSRFASSAMSSHPILGAGSSSSSSNKYELFASGSENNGSVLYSHFNGGNAPGLSQSNILASGFDFLSGYGANSTGNGDNLLQMQQRRLSSAAPGLNEITGGNFLCEPTNVNDLSHNESASLLNLSTNTTTAHNINSMLNDMLQ
jgi:hypothetical protein